MLIILYILYFSTIVNYFVGANNVNNSDIDTAQLINDVKDYDWENNVNQTKNDLYNFQNSDNSYLRYKEIFIMFDKLKQGFKDFKEEILEKIYEKAAEANRKHENLTNFIQEILFHQIIEKNLTKINDIKRNKYFDEKFTGFETELQLRDIKENEIHENLFETLNEFKKAKEDFIESQNEIKQIKDELIQSQKEIKQTKQELIQSKKTLGRIQLLFDISMKMTISKNTFTDSDGKLKIFFIPLNEINEKNSFEEAINTCKKYNAILVEPKTAQKQQILELFFKELEFQGIKIRWFWINGKRDSSGKFKWISSGEEFTFSNWLPNKPDSSNGHDYVWLYSYVIGEETPKFGKWGNDPNDPSYKYFHVACEKEIYS